MAEERKVRLYRGKKGRAIWPCLTLRPERAPSALADKQAKGGQYKRDYIAGKPRRACPVLTGCLPAVGRDEELHICPISPF